MHKKRKRTLFMLFFMLSGTFLAIGFVLYALRSNINLYYTPQQIINTHVLGERKIRLGGLVVPGSVHYSAHDLLVTFAVTDFIAKIPVVFNGVLPALFHEGQGIIAEGHLNRKGSFIANYVLAKHDENYHPPDIGKIK